MQYKCFFLLFIQRTWVFISIPSGILLETLVELFMCSWLIEGVWKKVLLLTTLWWIFNISRKNHEYVLYQNNESTSCMTKTIRISFLFKPMHALYVAEFKIFFIGKVLNRKSFSLTLQHKKQFQATTRTRPFTYFIVIVRKENANEPRDGKSFEYTSIQQFFVHGNFLFIYNLV